MRVGGLVLVGWWIGRRECLGGWRVLDKGEGEKW